MLRVWEDITQSADLDLLGVAPGGEFPAVPPWARSVVVLGMTTLDRAFDHHMSVNVDNHNSLLSRF